MVINHGDHLFLNYIFFSGQLLLINRGGIINPHLTIFFSSAGLLRPGGRAATASFTFDTGRAVTHGLQLELKKAVAARIRVWASN